MAVDKVALDSRNQRRRLHSGDEMAEKALLAASKAERAADLAWAFSVRAPPAILADRDLLVGELVLDPLIFDALVGERAGGIETEAFEIAGEHFHGGDAADLDRLDEFRARGEGEVLAAPEAETLGVGEVLDGSVATLRLRFLWQ